jgi:hypothetical protein
MSLTDVANIIIAIVSVLKIKNNTDSVFVTYHKIAFLLSSARKSAIFISV